MFTVVRNDVLELEAAVPARFAGDVRPAMPVRFNAAGREMNGRVARVSPTINPANRSVTIYLQLPNPGGTLKGNTFATGRIVAKTIDGTVIVPTSAIRYGQQQKPFVIARQRDRRAPAGPGLVDEATGSRRSRRARGRRPRDCRQRRRDRAWREGAHRRRPRRSVE
jgi:multidrug efflux pump subunit AcrA (membrane-fusion protein)